ncbi:MAG: penicillin-binding protein 2 [Campylobacterota bacterium]|nr:penicillin-binding protein 2 [Campylobacterota bacterium]
MRLKVIIGFIVLISVLLLSRVYYLSILSHDHFEELSKKNYIKRFYTTSSRGAIKDRNGKYLAVNEVGFSIKVKPHLRSKNKFKVVEDISKQVVKHFPKFKYEKLIKKYKRLDSVYKHNFVTLVDYIPYDDFFKHYTVFNSNDHIEIASVTRRQYIYKDVAAHILGYMGKTTQKDIELDNYSKYFEKSGRAGIEKYYDKVLRGTVGYQDVQVNSLYEKLKVIDEVKPKKNDITLTIDIELQKYIHELFNKKAGAVVVMDINNGELLAAGSFPEFDNNIFVNGISHKDWRRIQEDFNHPFTNKLINGLYPPGSVMKMGVAISFLENKINPNFKVYCTSDLQLGSRKFRCWKEKGHYTTGFVKAIRESCDDFFYKGSLKVGINNIHNTLDRFGIGHKTGIDLPNEFYGINPNKKWKKEVRKKPWYVGETVVSSIGQGFISVTPMQIARYTGAMANNKLQVPHLNKDDSLIESIDTNISSRDMKIVDKGMYDVANHPKGTATRYVKSKIKVAAKTGTAQVVGIPQSEKKRMKEHELEYFKRSHAWLTTFAPYKDPKYVVTILVEHGGHGGHAAGGMAGKIYDKLFELGYIKGKK